MYVWTFFLAGVSDGLPCMWPTFAGGMCGHMCRKSWNSGNSERNKRMESDDSIDVNYAYHRLIIFRWQVRAAFKHLSLSAVRVSVRYKLGLCIQAHHNRAKRQHSLIHKSFIPPPWLSTKGKHWCYHSLHKWPFMTCPQRWTTQPCPKVPKDFLPSLDLAHHRRGAGPLPELWGARLGSS